MAHVTTSDQDEPEEKPKITLVRVNDLHRTSQQVKTLIGILEECRPLCETTYEIGTNYDVDKEARKAAVDTYCLTQSQLRNVVDDQNRWSKFDSHEESFAEQIAKKNLEVAEEQRRNLIEFRRPSRIFGAQVRQQLVRAPGQPDRMLWVSYLGKRPVPGGVVGLGRTPDEAMRSFDQVFAQAQPEQPAQSAPPAPSSTAAEETSDPAPKRKRKNTNGKK